MDGRTRVLVGTTKGAFVLRNGNGDWDVSGPHCDGWPINHVLGDPATGRLWAAGGGEWHGAGVWRSDDGGATWDLSLLSNGKFDAWLTADPAMAEQFGMQPNPPAPHTGQVEALWSLGLTSGTLFAGGKPGRLFASRDGGVTWDGVEALNAHP
ncbi:MAG: exo-alpha-sialidase, partial [Rhodobacteraceae bacterium]|nr:exo-alpha-sialidase [Paracoccaceae bacterium]